VTVTRIDRVRQIAGCRCDTACTTPCVQRLDMTDRPCAEGHPVCDTRRLLASFFNDDGPVAG
jgi:hypothetical protein